MIAFPSGVRVWLATVNHATPLKPTTLHGSGGSKAPAQIPPFGGYVWTPKARKVEWEPKHSPACMLTYQQCGRWR
jgi:hypothetical protein